MTSCYLLPLLLTSLALLPASQKEFVQQRKEVVTFLQEESFPKLLEKSQKWYEQSHSTRFTRLFHLTQFLTENKHVSLKDTADMVVAYRMTTGEMKFQGHGLFIRQDLFTVAGRAAYQMEVLMELTLPELNEGLAEEARRERIEAIREVLQAYMNGYRNTVDESSFKRPDLIKAYRAGRAHAQGVSLSKLYPKYPTSLAEQLKTSRE